MSTNSTPSSVAPAPRAPAPASRTAVIKTPSIAYYDKKDLANAVGDISERAKRFLAALNDPKSPNEGPNSESGTYSALRAIIDYTAASVSGTVVVEPVPAPDKNDGEPSGGVDPIAGTCDPGLTFHEGRCYEVVPTS